MKPAKKTFQGDCPDFIFSIMKLITITLLLSLLPAFGVQLFSASVRASESRLEKTNLIQADTGGYAHYPIPGIVVTSRGTLLASCEARKSTRGDWGTIDLLLRRSSDGGTTWDPARKITTPPGDVKKIRPPSASPDSTWSGSARSATVTMS